MSRFKAGDKVRVRFGGVVHNATVMLENIAKDWWGDEDTEKRYAQGWIPTEGDNMVRRFTPAEDIIMGWAEEPVEGTLLERERRALESDPTRQRRDAILAQLFGGKAPAPVTSVGILPYTVGIAPNGSLVVVTEHWDAAGISYLILVNDDRKPHQNLKKAPGWRWGHVFDRDKYTITPPGTVTIPKEVDRIAREGLKDEDWK